MRFIGMDVHRDWCEVAVAEGGELRSGERVKAEPEALELFAQSLAPDDEVVLEATFGAARIAEIIEPHVARVVVADPRRLAKADSRKTDRRDARKLARLLASGFLDEVWTPDEATRSLRRLVARRASIVKARTRAKNEVHAALGRNLCPRPPMKDLFGRGQAGAGWPRSSCPRKSRSRSTAACARSTSRLRSSRRSTGFSPSALSARRKPGG